MTGLASRVGWAVSTAASLEAGCVWLDSTQGPGARAGRPGSCSLAMVESDGLPSAAERARCLAYRWSPGLAAICLKQEGSAADH